MGENITVTSLKNMQAIFQDHTMQLQRQQQQLRSHRQQPQPQLQQQQEQTNRSNSSLTLLEFMSSRGYSFSSIIAKIAAAAAAALGATAYPVVARGTFNMQCAAPRAHVQQ